MKLNFDNKTEYSTGIYIIENLKDHKFYIGQTVDIKRRFNDHVSKLNCITHDNTHLQRAFVKYGTDSFVMYMIQSCSKEILDKTEQEWVDCFWDNCKECYNIKLIANKPPNRKGSKLTEEQLRKWSQVKLGKTFTKEHKRKIGEAHKDKKRKPFTEEWKRNMETSHSKTYDIKLLSPSGQIYGPITNALDFCRVHGLYACAIQYLISGKIKQAKGWRLLP